MTEHWTEKYLGKPWTPEQNCYYWFREIMEREFGHKDMPAVVTVQESEAARVAARGFTDELFTSRGWRRVTDGLLREGDAAYLTQGRTRATHIGVVFFRHGRRLILHARKGIGVVASDQHGLALNFLRERGFWRYAGTL